MLNGQKVDIQRVAGSDFQPIPMDKYTVQITDVNFKKQFNSFKQIEEDVLNYEFTVLDNKTMDGTDAEGKSEPQSIRGRKLWRRCTPKFGAKTWLSKLASAALGHELTEAEEDKFQPEDIIDLQVDVMVDLKPGTGENAKTMYNNIISFAKVSKELTPFENDKSQKVEGKVSKPVVEEMDDEESDDFIKGLDEDKKKKD